MLFSQTNFSAGDWWREEGVMAGRARLKRSLLAAEDYWKKVEIIETPQLITRQGARGKERKKKTRGI